MSSSDASSHDGSSSGIAGTATGIVQGNPGAAESKDLPAIPGFEILGELGRGGMGVVYRARETALDRVVALKILPGGFLVGEEQVTRFRREARAAASLDHPGIVKAHHVGVWGPVNYIVQEYIEGTSLDRWLLSRGPLSPREAVELLLPLVRAVAHAHERGIVHRDLKPANVLIDRSGQPKLTDFGLARRANDTRLTQSGAALGTPAYMAPEQAEGIPSAVGERTDVYGLGAILYEALVGTPPLSLHSGEHPAALLLRILRESPLAVRAHRPEIDSQLDALCMRCLEKNPGNRYPSAGALAAALEDYLASGLSSPRRVPGREAASLPADGGAERVLVEVAVAPASPPAPTTGAAEAADFAPSPSPAPPVPLAVRAHSGHHARLAGRRGILALALLFLLVAAGSVAVWKGLPGLGNKPGPRKRPIPEAGPKTWAEAEAQSARLAEAGQPFEAARALHEARALPGGKAGAEEAARIEALLAASVEAAAARGEDGRACEELAWWTAHYPDSSPERVRALEVLILSSSIDRAAKAGDFPAAAAALRHLVSLAPEEGGDSRAVWAGFLSERLEDRALAGECHAAMDALEVLSVWGAPSGAERRRRMAEFLAPFCAEGSDLSAAYRPFWTEDMALGLPVLRAFEVRRDVDGRVYRFVLPRGAPGESGEASHFQIALFPRDMHAARTTAAQAEIHRNDIMARTKHLQETGHDAIDLAGLECETYTFVRPAESGGSDTFVEFYLFQKGPTVYVLTLALGRPELADLRPILLVSISHLKVH